MAGTPEVKPNFFYLELVFYFIIVVLTWTASVTILLPLYLCLVFSDSFRDKVFAKTFSAIVFPFTAVIRPYRKKTFEQFPVGNRNLKVLEIGVGPGFNFDFYPANCELTLLDINKHFETNIRKKLEDYPNLKVEKFVIGTAEDMQGIPDSTFDVVVSTYVLCYVRDTAAALKEVSRVLKPDGKYIYLEHVGFPAATAARWIQTLVNPVWRIYINGCNLTRAHDIFINEVFVHNSYKLMYPLLIPFLARPQIIGTASQSQLSEK